MNKDYQLRILGLIGFSIFIFGVMWEIGVSYPELFKNIVISITMPPTYRILELVGLIIFLGSVYYLFKNLKKESEV